MELEKTKKFIVQWINDYAKKNCIKNLIIGISGGIDSALTSTLCAMTGINTTVISLPIKQSKNELENATKHMKWLKTKYQNIQTITIELNEVLAKYQNTIPKNYHSDLGFANTRARIRMMTLYQIASTHNGIVVGTGNKLGKDKGNSKYLYELFPYGPGKQACKFAGLPKPTGCV